VRWYRNRPGIDSRPGGVGGVGNQRIVGKRQPAYRGSGNTINRGEFNVGGYARKNVAGIGARPGYGVGRTPAYKQLAGARMRATTGMGQGYWHGYTTTTTGAGAGSQPAAAVGGRPGPSAVVL